VGVGVCVCVCVCVCVYKTPVHTVRYNLKYCNVLKSLFCLLSPSELKITNKLQVNDMTIKMNLYVSVK